MNDPQVFPRDAATLIAMLEDPDPVTREQVADALGRAVPETEDIILALGKALFDTVDEVCIAAGVSLFACGSRTAPVIPHLIKAIQHRNVFVRRLAIATLSSIGPDAKDALPAITKQLESPDSHVRMWSITALKNIGEQKPKKDNKKKGNEPS